MEVRCVYGTLSAPSVQFSFKTKTVLKNEVYYLGVGGGVWESVMDAEENAYLIPNRACHQVGVEIPCK